MMENSKKYARFLHPLFIENSPRLQIHTMSKLQLWIFVQFSALAAASDPIYHNQIAVHVLGGDAVVEKVARRSGMTSLGRIGDLQDLYLLESHLIRKR